MTFDEYAARAAETARYPDRGSNLYYPVLGLTGEAGEVADKVKKVMRDNDGVLTDETRESLKKEMGDVLWYIAAMCHELGVSMEEVARGNIEKLRSRMERDKIGGSGDDR